MKKVVIIGAGPGGIFTAYELVQKASAPLKVGVFELGNPLNRRKCPIDGEKVKTMRSDVLYTAVVLPSGRHEVELRYRTPYMREGLIVSLLTLAALYGAWNHKKSIKKSL